MISKGNVQNLSFKDKYLGDLGCFIWIIPVAIIFFGSFFYVAVKISFLQHLWNLGGILFLILMYAICISSLGWFLYETREALKIIQEIELGDKGINVILYFRKKIKINFNETTSIKLLKENSCLLKKHRCVQTETPCLQITTKDNKYYLITPHMERFDELQDKLKNILKNNESSKKV
tara:strand:+ start:254 stop:784 length:531 start_codon:yes stop_codon:yes gene_type:complete